MTVFVDTDPSINIISKDAFHKIRNSRRVCFVEPADIPLDVLVYLAADLSSLTINVHVYRVLPPPSLLTFLLGYPRSFITRMIFTFSQAGMVIHTRID